MITRILPILTSIFLALLVVRPAFAQGTPLVEYTFDEGSGTTAFNSGSIGSGADGGISNAVYSSDTPSGSGTSLHFDGDTDYVAFPDTFDYGSAVTVEAWIKPSALNGQRAVYDDYGNPGVFMAIFDGRLQWNITTTSHTGQGISIYGGLLCTGVWQHVAGTYDGTIMRAYIDGVEIGNLTNSGAIIDDTTIRTTIGADNSTPSALEFAGNIDDLRVFATALTPDQLGGGLAISNTLCPSVDVGLAKLDGPDPVTNGASLHYSFQIHALGNVPAENVVLTDVLPPSMNFGSLTSSHGTSSFSAGTATFFLGTITNNSYAFADIWVTPTVVGSITNTASVTTTSPDEIPQNDTSSAVTSVLPAGTDLTAQLDAAFGACVDGGNNKLLCPVDAELTLRNSGLVYGNAVLDLDNSCNTKKVPAKCKLKGTLTVNELDLTGLEAHNIAFYLSEDSVLDAGDFRMQEIKLSKALASFIKGKSVKLSLKLPANIDLTGQHIIAVVDSANDVAELNENNNAGASSAIPAMP